MEFHEVSALPGTRKKDLLRLAQRRRIGLIEGRIFSEYRRLEKLSAAFGQGSRARAATKII